MKRIVFSISLLFSVVFAFGQIPYLWKVGDVFQTKIDTTKEPYSIIATLTITKICITKYNENYMDYQTIFDYKIYYHYVNRNKTLLSQGQYSMFLALKDNKFYFYSDVGCDHVCIPLTSEKDTSFFVKRGVPIIKVNYFTDTLLHKRVTTIYDSVSVGCKGLKYVEGEGITYIQGSHVGFQGNFKLYKISTEQIFVPRKIVERIKVQ